MFALAEPPALKPRSADGQRSPLAPAVEFHYTQTDSFVALLQQLGASLLVSTYQANKLLAVRAAGQGVSTLVRSFERPMGLAVDADRLTIGTRNQIWFLRNARDIAPRVEPAGQHDACYLPRSCHVTGDIGIHELAWAGEELWVVNTRFSWAVVDVRSGHVIALLEFQTAVEEIFDVQLRPGLGFPEVIGFQQETIQHTFVVPPVRPDNSWCLTSGDDTRRPSS
jgi:hypothetical protein